MPVDDFFATPEERKHMETNVPVPIPPGQKDPFLVVTDQERTSMVAQPSDPKTERLDGPIGNNVFGIPTIPAEAGAPDGTTSPTGGATTSPAAAAAGEKKESEKEEETSKKDSSNKSSSKSDRKGDDKDPKKEDKKDKKKSDKKDKKDKDKKKTQTSAKKNTPKKVIFDL
ncbi:hypothetical protein PMAYCL1PPCAC_26740 [Pristionchus mayeri]|uniref:Uncharacterized protein n=1 Tax=Pristionchus mayeri TaxID=1317129 RepID=A0AAN5D6I4_9BILA|nr:hypothetical protein PMAYCL1PPCAC_26740 [Pristionchus mayeri]